MFRYFEYLVKSKDKVYLDKFESIVKESRIYLLEAGYDDYIIDEFQEVQMPD